MRDLGQIFDEVRKKQQEENEAHNVKPIVPPKGKCIVCYKFKTECDCDPAPNMASLWHGDETGV